MDGEEKIKKAYESILNSDFEQAIEWFEEAIEQEPGNALFHYKLSITYARSNKLTKALEHAEKASSLDNSNEEYLFHYEHIKAKELVKRAEVYFDQNEDQLHLAIILLKEATYLDPLSVEAWLLMGIAYAQLEEYSQAIQTLKEVLNLDPNHEIAKELLKQYKMMFKIYLQSYK
ncbi:tetratricopeptide repeat protein [Chengkuizengella axinellae]|uniref:Tetratricopeptide repeat protein n=1 Tax=Chengkuizengella axinellae TaxID=3064388 RepID=A0ABT9IWT2_9BACL|nr:tetratricopeptide repeat protein [Chengkuizengella sp. 2205SS18-9]MDP5273829.1 tetratricopeptide repeat protein [Chengkuizengella sp. 2205SS18-9]